jgi:hypothetical protein
MLSDHSQAATKHYATLRGALRALSPEPEVLGTLDIESRFRQIRSWIQQGAGSETSETQIRAKIDGALAEVSTEMLAIIRRSSFWQFRATLPTVRAESPGDLESLLQICLSDPDKRWSDLVDYVVTLLATREVGGRRQLERDPTSVAVYLHDICAEAAHDATEESEVLAAKIDEASDALAAGEPIGEIVQRVRELKRAAENQLLIPHVLRSVVAFNVVVGNRVVQQQEVRRSLDQAELDVFSESESGESSQPSEPSVSNPLPAFGSFELEAVESAFQIRLARGAAIDSPAHRVAGVADISKLSVFEKDAFRDRSSARVSRIVRSVVTIGLVVRHIDDAAGDLEQLGIDAEWLRRSSAGEIDKLAQVGIRELTRSCEFDQAQQLAELRARYLNPLFDEDLLIRPTLARASEPAVTAVDQKVSEPSDAPVSRSELPAEPMHTVPPARSTKSTPRTKRKRAEKPVQGGSRWGIIAAGVLLTIALGAVTITRINRDSNPTQFTNDQLTQITPYLTRGHTTTEGSVTTFYGVVNQTWSRVPIKLKQREAFEIGVRMEEQGVSSVKFYDFKNKLQLYYLDGRIRHLE